MFALSLLIGAVVAAPPAAVDYERDVKPVLKERCFACHGALKTQGKLRVDTVAMMLKGGSSGPAVVAGDPEASMLVERITEADQSLRMPPEGQPLKPEQVAAIRAWIATGAKGPADEKPEADPRDHWAFRVPVRPPIPASAKQNLIDAFLAAEWVRRGLEPRPETDKATLLRRVFLDLIGLPPTREQLHEFLSDDRPDAYDRVVDRLLASPQHGERWARHWMDVWRYSDWYGRRSVPDVLNSYARIWRWRDWIVESLNADRGYDRMVMEMLAGDEIAPADDRAAAATGFLVRNFYRWNYHQWMRDAVEHTGKAFLGLTFNCCQCHDHKYDPVSQLDYFRFRAFFEPLEIRHERMPNEPDPGVFPKYEYTKSYQPITGGLVRVMDEKLDASTLVYSGGDERNVVKGRPPVVPAAPAPFGTMPPITPIELPPESWYPGLKPFIQREETTAREQAVAARQAELAAAIAAIPPIEAALAELEAPLTPGKIVPLPVIEKQKLLQSRLAAARKEPAVAQARIDAAQAELEAVKARITADNVRYGKVPGDADATARAAAKAEKIAVWKAALVEVARADTPTSRAAADKAKAAIDNAGTTYAPLGPVYPKQSTGRRTALAKWIADRSNPLTARVAVNHVWNWHFGKPLVETTADFGRNGKPPTHPELLDWLAVEFMESGWSMKHLHRLIVTSAAYRMSSHPGTADHPNRRLDADNVALWRFPTGRVDAEVVRDSLLHLAGELDPKMGGEDIPFDQGLTVNRRSLYFTHHGEGRMQFLELFDAASACDCYRRATSVRPQQALALGNSELTARTGRTLAARLWASLPESQPSVRAEAFVRAAFEQVLARPARPAEEQAAHGFLARQQELFKANSPDDAATRARANLVIALLNHNDFITVR